MEKVPLKEILKGIAARYNFCFSSGFYYKKSNECIVVLELQKSNYGSYFQVNIKVFIQGLFDKTYLINKDLIHKNVPDLFLGIPKEYENLFDLEYNDKLNERKVGLEKLFESYINPLSEKLLTKEGIHLLSEKGEIFILPTVRRALNL